MTAVDESSQTARRVIDGDGHIMEDPVGIVRHLPEEFRSGFESGRFSLLFPPLDHFHGMPMRIRGSERHGGQIAPSSEHAVGPEEWLDFLTTVDIERTVLYPTFALSYGKIRDRGWAIAVTRAYNEWLSETYLSRDARFRGMAILPLQDPPVAARELRHAVKDLGLSGAVLPANGLPVHLASKEFWPVFEEAEQLGCALTVHGGCHDGFGFDEMNVYAPVHALGHPFGQLIAFGGLLFNGVFDRWPGLRVGFLEGGAAWVLLALERFDESFESHLPIDSQNELLDLGSKGDVRDYVLELLRSGRVVIGCEGGEPDTSYVIKRIGMNPFFYSSDFPHEVTIDSCLEELREFEDLELTAEERNATLADNAERFYRL